jgi:hypothetical protein
MATDQARHHPLLASHAVLIGLTPLIPVPFVDDAVEGWLWRSMVRALANTRQLALADHDVRALAEGPSGSLLRTAARGVLLYPVKRLIRKAFFALEGKRMIDLTSRAYCVGYLIDVAFARGWHQPAGRAASVREAAERACREVGTSPVESAVRTAFESSKTAVSAAARAVGSAMPWRQGASQGADEAARSAASGVGARVDGAIGNLPASYFERLTRAFATALGEDAGSDHGTSGPGQPHQRLR